MLNSIERHLVVELCKSKALAGFSMDFYKNRNSKDFKKVPQFTEFYCDRDTYKMFSDNNFITLKKYKIYAFKL